jgi:hypothetical protein
MESCLKERQEPQVVTETIITCEFCNRPAEISVEKIIHGNLELVWVCNHCTKSKMFIRNWEIIQ